MPMNLDFVATCYGIWLVTMVVYAVTVRHKSKTYNQALEGLKGRKKS